MRTIVSSAAALAILCVSGLLPEGHAAPQERANQPPLFHAFLWGVAVSPQVLDNLPSTVRNEVEKRLSTRRSYRARLAVPDGLPMSKGNRVEENNNLRSCWLH